MVEACFIEVDIFSRATKHDTGSNDRGKVQRCDLWSFLANGYGMSAVVASLCRHKIRTCVSSLPYCSSCGINLYCIYQICNKNENSKLNILTFTCHACRKMSG